MYAVRIHRPDATEHQYGTKTNPLLRTARTSRHRLLSDPLHLRTDPARRHRLSTCQIMSSYDASCVKSSNASAAGWITSAGRLSDSGATLGDPSDCVMYPDSFGHW